MTQRQFSYAELFEFYGAARVRDYRSDPERAEVIAAETERVLYLLLRRLALGEEAPGKEG